MYQIPRDPPPARFPKLLVLLSLTISILSFACDDENGPPDPAPNLEVHHWLALEAIEVNNSREAIHQVDHIIELVEGDHRMQMERVVELLEAGQTHDAQHVIQQMLAGRAAPDLSVREIHLHMTLEAAQHGRLEQAQHHLEHFTAGAPEFASESAVVEFALRQADRNAAEYGLRSLLATVMDVDAPTTDCEATVAWPLADDTIRVAVLWDDEWAHHHGDQLSVVEDARKALAFLGIRLEVVGGAQWDARPATSLREIAREAASVPPADLLQHDLLIVFTARDYEGTRNGVYSTRGPTVAVSHRHHTPEVDAPTLVHEIGHFLGLPHRPGSYMQAVSFPLGIGWSDCQRAIVRESTSTQ